MSNTFFIDGVEIPFEADDVLLSAALRAGHYIPHFCYHKELSCSATCRMCMVEMHDANGKPLPKLITSCSEPAKKGVNISLSSNRVIEARKAVMEFLLINHPLDCSICDQSGECDLQDFSHEYGSGKSQMEHEKRVYGPREIGTFLELERNRCIHCTRCVRFTEEITGTHELATFGRSHQLTVDTFIDKPLSDKFQGNLADICPVGAITLRDFRFRKRVWKLGSIASICDQCATGCNINLEHERGKLHRIKPRENMAVNRTWMCDYGRIGFRDYYDSNKRQLQFEYEGTPVNSQTGFAKLLEIIEQAQNSRLVVISSGHSTLEEAYSLTQFTKLFFPKAELFYPEPPLELAPKERWIDNLISADKAPNLAALKYLGFEKLTLKHLLAITALPHSTVLTVGKLNDHWQEILSKLTKETPLIQLLTAKPKLLANRGLVVPILAGPEKSGIFINRAGRAQKLQPLPRLPLGAIEECSLFGKLAAKLTSQAAVAKNPQEALAMLIADDQAMANLANIDRLGVQILAPAKKSLADAN